ncbi:MAG TPA: CAP domain-containing protein [Spirochaetia bacterium]|nr:CAP domain-containing protein [Spirochaetia bacterium]
MAHPFITLFAPHPHNNHKAKVLWPRSIVILIGLFIMGRSIVDITIGLRPGVLGYASQIDPDKVIELTNKERLNAGVTIVKTNSELNQAALAKATDMFENNYWAHISPTGTEPWYFVTHSGYQYQHAGENLARDFSNPSDVVKAWMASPTHRQNLLDDRYHDIGVAVLDGYINGVETTLVVQMFGSTKNTVAKIASTNITKTAYAEETLPKHIPSSGLSPLDLSRAWSLAFVVLILFVLSIDWIFVLRYNIVRISGKTWAHITYFAGLAIILIIIRQGIVL